MTARGGAQRIPRPPSARPGGPAIWHDLAADARRFGLADVRAVLDAADAPARAVPELPGEQDHGGSRPAAVLLAMFERDGEARVVLTKRPDTMPSHQGEIAFPGGKYDAAVDDSLIATALREAHEEVGLVATAVEIVGALTPLRTVASSFVITPFVGFCATEPDLVPHEREVVSVFDVALGELLDPETHRREVWPVRDTELHVDFYLLPGETVWGATARMLTDLLGRLTAARRSAN